MGSWSKAHQVQKSRWLPVDLRPPSRGGCGGGFGFACVGIAKGKRRAAKRLHGMHEHCIVERRRRLQGQGSYGECEGEPPNCRRRTRLDTPLTAGRPGGSTGKALGPSCLDGSRYSIERAVGSCVVLAPKGCFPHTACTYMCRVDRGWARVAARAERKSSCRGARSQACTRGPEKPEAICLFNAHT